MSAATASVADVSRTDGTYRDDGRPRNNSGQSQAQCTPMSLPALGTQKIIQGNGTNVGTVILLQCPAKYKVVGGEVTCVMDVNSTHWDGKTYCTPLAPFEAYGFRVAVLASIVSSAIILLMSMAFITCCLLDCVKEDKRKKQQRETDMWQWEEPTQHQGDNAFRYSHKGRNNNNNNTQEKMFPLWNSHNLDMQARGYHQEYQYPYGPACAYSRAAPLAALPGHGYDQPLVPRTPESVQISGPPQYLGPPAPSVQPPSPHGVQVSGTGPGPVWQYGRQEHSSPTAEECNTRNSNPAKEFSIRIISV